MEFNYITKERKLKQVKKRDVLYFLIIDYALTPHYYNLLFITKLLARGYLVIQ